MLELDDIQNGAIHPRPSPYVGAYIVLRIDDRHAGRELLRRLIPTLADATSPMDPSRQAWVSVGLSFQGLEALGVPQDSLDSFPLAFQQGMAARAAELGDVGDSAPENWEKPFGTPDVHVGLSALSPDTARLEPVLARARTAFEELSGVTAIWHLDCHVLPTEKEAFGFRDGISHPAVEGSGIPGSNPREQPIKAGEFLLGYPNERRELPPIPRPEVLGKNGTYVAFRKLHQRVAAFRQYLKANSSSPEEEDFLAAKMMGRWQSGAPLALCPMHDDPELGADPKLNNDFLYNDDPQGLKTPAGSHIRRLNPRDSEISGFARFHRMIRRGTSYGPMLPPGVIVDDGAERGLAFVFVGANLERQFEFVQSEWVNKGQFFHGPAGDKDPIAGANSGSDRFTIPQQPIRRRLQGLPAFVVTRGGEYFFVPGLRALRWLADLET
ncbi:Dyp-type peroxidase [Nocardia tengchongensis]